MDILDELKIGDVVKIGSGSAYYIIEKVTDRGIKIRHTNGKIFYQDFGLLSYIGIEKIDISPEKFETLTKKVSDYPKELQDIKTVESYINEEWCEIELNDNENRYSVSSIGRIKLINFSNILGNERLLTNKGNCKLGIKEYVNLKIGESRKTYEIESLIAKYFSIEKLKLYQEKINEEIYQTQQKIDVIDNEVIFEEFDHTDMLNIDNLKLDKVTVLFLKSYSNSWDTKKYYTETYDLEAHQIMKIEYYRFNLYRCILITIRDFRVNDKDSIFYKKVFNRSFVTRFHGITDQKTLLTILPEIKKHANWLYTIKGDKLKDVLSKYVREISIYELPT